MSSINQSTITEIIYILILKNIMDVNLNVSIVTLFLLLVFLTCALKLLNWVWFRPKRLEKLFRKQGMNGNSYRLIVGDARDFMSLMRTEQRRSIKLSDDLPSHIYPYQKQIIEKHGDNSFMWLGTSPHLLITDPQMIHDIFTNTETFQKPVPNPLGEILGRGLPFLEGDEWTLHRKIIQTVFRVENLKNMTSSIGMSCSIMVDRWESLVSNDGKSSEIDVWPSLSDFTGDVISRTAFGSTYEEGRRIFELQKEQTELFMQHITYSYVPGFRYIPTNANRRLKAISKEIKSLLRGMICKREKTIEKGETTSNDLLGMLMESNYKEIKESGNKNKGMSVEDVIEECRLFYFSGSDTTSVLLVWTMVMLSKHQEWQARAREEVLHIFGKKEPTFDGLNRLKVVNMILQEVLRLYPPVPVTLRAPIKTTKLGKLNMPAGAILMLLIGLTHHDPLIWGDNTGEFKPERFAEGISSAMKVPFSFIPFAFGPRVCIGQQFAMIEAKMALAMILQRFTFELSPSYQHTPFGIMTLQPQYGAPLLFNKI